MLFGKDRSLHDLGLVPCAINWLYRCINEIRDQQRIRMLVRVSAIEVFGRSEKLRDLLVGFCEGGFIFESFLTLLTWSTKPNNCPFRQTYIANTRK